MFREREAEATKESMMREDEAVRRLLVSLSDKRKSRASRFFLFSVLPVVFRCY